MLQKAQQVVFDKLINLIEQSSLLPWQCPWKKDKPGNAIGKEPYKGINAFMASMDTAINGYETGKYLTFKQANELGLRVNKGSKALPILYYNTHTKEVNGDEKTIFVARYYQVFNLDQLTGDKTNLLPRATTEERDKRDFPDAMLALNTSKFPDIFESPSQAYYQPSTDKIYMPRHSLFSAVDDFWSVAFHEIAHSTGHETRLNRFKTGDKVAFGSEVYSREELIAEFSASFLCQYFGFKNTLNQSASYLKSWVKFLKDHPRELFQAASQAEKVFTYLTEFSAEEGKKQNLVEKFKRD